MSHSKDIMLLTFKVNDLLASKSNISYMQGVCCLDIGFRHISLAPLRIKFHCDCSAQKINRHLITLLYLRSSTEMRPKAAFSVRLESQAYTLDV